MRMRNVIILFVVLTMNVVLGGTATISISQTEVSVEGSVGDNPPATATVSVEGGGEPGEEETLTGTTYNWTKSGEIEIDSGDETTSALTVRPNATTQGVYLGRVKCTVTRKYKNSETNEITSATSTSVSCNVKITVSDEDGFVFDVTNAPIYVNGRFRYTWACNSDISVRSVTINVGSTSVTKYSDSGTDVTRQFGEPAKFTTSATFHTDQGDTTVDGPTVIVNKATINCASSVFAIANVPFTTTWVYPDAIPQPCHWEIKMGSPSGPVIDNGGSGDEGNVRIDLFETYCVMVRAGDENRFAYKLIVGKSGKILPPVDNTGDGGTSGGDDEDDDDDYVVDVDVDVDEDREIIYQDDTFYEDGSVPFFLEVGDVSGSHSEAWRLHVGEAAHGSKAGETSVSDLFWFPADDFYDCSLEHVGTIKEDGVPDYDYVAYLISANRSVVDGETVYTQGKRYSRKLWYGGKNFVIDNNHELYGNYHDKNDWADCSARLYVPTFTLEVVDDTDKSNVQLRLKLTLASQMKDDGLTKDNAGIFLYSVGGVVLKAQDGTVLCEANKYSENLWDKLSSNNEISFKAEIPAGNAFCVRGRFFVRSSFVAEDDYSYDLDLDTDSDNDNGDLFPDESAEEDEIEDSAEKIGKLIQVNDQDSDQDGILDYGDWDASGMQRVPVRLKLIKWNEDSKIRFEYDASDPENVTLNSNENGKTTVYLPNGRFRLWKTDPREEHVPDSITNDGSFIESGVTYTYDDFLLSREDPEITLYVEAVRSGKGTITVYYDRDSTDEIAELSDKINICGFTMETVVPSADYYTDNNYNSTPKATKTLGICMPTPSVSVGSVDGHLNGDKYSVVLSDIKVLDPIVDNLPRGSGADIEDIEIYLDGNKVTTQNLTTEQSGTVGFWRQHPYKGSCDSYTVDVPLTEGSHSISVKTSENIAGNTAEALVNVSLIHEEVLNGSNNYVGNPNNVSSMVNFFLNSSSANSIDKMYYFRGDRDAILPPEEGADFELTETGNDTNVFTGNINGLNVVVTLIGYTGLTDQIDNADIKIAYYIDGIQLERLLACTETGEATRTFRKAFDEISNGLNTVNMLFPLNDNLANIVNKVKFDTGTVGILPDSLNLIESAADSLTFISESDGVTVLVENTEVYQLLDPTDATSADWFVPATGSINLQDNFIEKIKANIKYTFSNGSVIIYNGIILTETSSNSRLFTSPIALDSVDGSDSGFTTKVWNMSVDGALSSPITRINPFTIRLSGLDEISDEELTDIGLVIGDHDISLEKRSDGCLYPKGGSHQVPSICLKNDKPLTALYNTENGNYYDYSLPNYEVNVRCRGRKRTKKFGGISVDIFDVKLAEIQSNGSTVFTSKVAQTFSSPKFSVTNFNISNVRANEDKTGIIGDVQISGTIRSDLLDMIDRSGDAKISTVTLSVGEDDLYDIDVTGVKSVDNTSMTKPYPFTGGYSFSKNGISLSEGSNTLYLSSVDDTGFSSTNEYQIDITATPPEPTDTIPVVTGIYDGYSFSISNNGKPSLKKERKLSELHPYVFKVIGKEDFIKNMVKEYKSIGNSAWHAIKACDGSYYLAMSENYEGIPTIMFSFSKDPFTTDLPSYDMTDGICDTGSALAGFVAGFCVDGPLAIVEDAYTVVITVADVGTLFCPLRGIYELTYGDNYQGEIQAAVKIAETAKLLAKVVIAMGNSQNKIFANVIMGDWEGAKDAGAVYSLALSMGAEVVEGMWDSYKNKAPYERGKMCGRAVFEIAALLAPYAKAGNLAKVSKLEITNKIKANSFFQAEGAAALQKLATFFERLATTKMCFPAGTLVHISGGTKNIEDIQVGDIVLSGNENSGQKSYKTVTETFVTYPDKLFRLSYAQYGETNSTDSIECTGSHPFYIAERGAFIPACEISLGEHIKLQNGLKGKITSISSRHVPEGTATYNFTVEDYHTYFVGINGIWVHNIGQPCENAFSIFYKILLKFDDNPMKARRLFKQKYAKYITETVDRGLVDDLIGDTNSIGSVIKRHYDAGTLDKRFCELGYDPAKQMFIAKEALGAYNFEQKFGLRLYRRKAAEGADFYYLKNGIKMDLDVWGPMRSDVFAGDWKKNLAASISSKSEETHQTVFDLSGMKNSEKKIIKSYIEKYFGNDTSRYFIYED